MRRSLFHLVVSLAIIGLLACQTPDRHNMRAPDLEALAQMAKQEDCYGIVRSDYTIDTLRVPRNSNLSSILAQLGVRSAHLGQLVQVLDTVFPASRIRAGNSCLFYSTWDSIPAFWVYHHTPTQFLRLDFRSDTLSALLDTLAITREPVSAHMCIESSLWNAAVDAGVRPDLAHSLSDIYAWSVDFFGLTQGDEFYVHFERQRIDSTELASGTVFCARYVSGSDTVNAYRFMQDSVWSYWDKEGNSLRKAFLKAPLHFSRISSHFTYARRHPILKIVRPHTGIDYAAPAGTPVMALGDGVVIGKGYERGGGNFVKIKHNSVYTTGYLHLSRFGKGIAQGTRVQQGQVIGYVGSTGLSTGPHLDFRLWKNGKPMNPLHLESPSVEPIDSMNRVAFFREVARQDSILDAISRLSKSGGSGGESFYSSKAY